MVLPQVVLEAVFPVARHAVDANGREGIDISLAGRMRTLRASLQRRLSIQ